MRKELQPRLGLPLVIDSDRVGYVAGEQRMDVAKELNDVVFLSVGTGIAAGIISNGQLLRGAAGIAGAAGWFALSSDLKDMYRQVGCWEAEAARTSLGAAPSARLSRRGHCTRSPLRCRGPERD